MHPRADGLTGIVPYEEVIDKVTRSRFSERCVAMDDGKARRCRVRQARQRANKAEQARQSKQGTASKARQGTLHPETRSVHILEKTVCVLLLRGLQTENRRNKKDLITSSVTYLLQHRPHHAARATGMGNISGVQRKEIYLRHAGSTIIFAELFTGQDRAHGSGQLLKTRGSLVGSGQEVF